MISSRRTLAWPRLIALISLAALSGCLAHQTRGVPLYRTAQRLPRDQVALLEGPVTGVDGAHFEGRSNAFELLPGCHVVEVSGRVGRIDPQYGGWVATIPQLYYAFRMRAGATYAIEFDPETTLGRRSTIAGTLTARERAADGSVRLVQPARDRAAIDDCRRWATGQHS